MGEEELKWKPYTVELGPKELWEALEQHEERLRLLEQRYWGVIAGLVLAVAHIYGGFA